MTAPAVRPVPRRALEDASVTQLLLPIVKRLPAYLRLGWALGKEPAIPRRHKALLVSAALYSVSPATLVVGVVPILGQIDSVVLFLLGLRQALAHCPPQIAARHLARVRLRPGQLDQDLATAGYVAKRTFNEVGEGLGTNLRFAGRVADGFLRRAARRILS